MKRTTQPWRRDGAIGLCYWIASARGIGIQRSMALVVQASEVVSWGNAWLLGQRKRILAPLLGGPHSPDGNKSQPLTMLVRLPKPDAVTPPLSPASAGVDHPGGMTRFIGASAASPKPLPGDFSLSTCQNGVAASRSSPWGDWAGGSFRRREVARATASGGQRDLASVPAGVGGEGRPASMLDDGQHGKCECGRW
jgi:hypothetical protein